MTKFASTGSPQKALRQLSSPGYSRFAVHKRAYASDHLPSDSPSSERSSLSISRYRINRIRLVALRKNKNCVLSGLGNESVSLSSSSSSQLEHQP